MIQSVLVLSTILALASMVATSMTLSAVAQSSADTTSASTTTTTTTNTPSPPKHKVVDNTVTLKPKEEKIVKHSPPSPKHPMKHKIVKHSADYQRRYKMGWNMSCADDMKETKLHQTMPHTKAFLDGYNDARQGDGPCPF